MMELRNSEEYTRNMSSSLRVKWKDEEFYNKQVSAHNKPDTKLLCSLAAKKGHSDPELAKKYRHPNRKYLFRLPNGNTVVRSKVATIRRNHPDWELIKEVTNDQ